MMRLFIGLAPDGAARDSLWNLASGLHCGGQRLPKENYHLTLAFLGMREETHAARMEPVLAQAAQSCTPLPLTVKGAGYFGNPHNALLYAKLEPSNSLDHLSDTLRDLLTAAGETFDEKPFVPHITLARKADISGIELQKPIRPFSFTVDRLTLYHSTRVEGALRYLPILEADFSAEG